MPTATDNGPTLGQKLLGGFVVLQFVAVFITNVAGFWTAFPKPIAVVAERYLELTGQPQGWAMFDAGPMCNSVAWDVRIELPGGAVHRVQGVARLPGDVARFNAPAALSRRFVYESSLLGIDLLLPDAGEFTPPQQAGFLEEVRSNNGSYEAFFRTIWHRERGLHPEWPDQPLTMELVILRQPIADPRFAGHEMPSANRYVARWKPGETGPNEWPVEAYDLNAPDPPYRKFAKP